MITPLAATRIAPGLALTLLLAWPGHAQLVTFTNETAYLNALSNATYGIVVEGFEDEGAWGHVRSSISGGFQTAAAVTNNLVIWQSNSPNNSVTTGTGAAFRGSYGLYSYPHGDYAHGYADGLRIRSLYPLFAVGGWFDTNTGGAQIRIDLDGDPVDFNQNLLISYGPFFYGVIDTTGFNQVLVEETEGAADDQKLMFADEFAFAAFTTSSWNAPRTFTEAFSGAANPAAPSEARWTWLWDSAATVAHSAAFAVNDGENIIKVTTDADDISRFTSAYLYCEHDIDESQETTISGNLYGQDAGDVLLHTTRPAYDNYASVIDVNGASFSVDYQLGGTFFFAIVLANGSRYALADSVTSFSAADVATASSAPIDAPVTEWRTILYAGGTPGQKMRLADTPGFLSADQLRSVRSVGLYVPPRSAPCRFDNLSLTGFKAASDTSPFRVTGLETTGDGIRISWAARPGHTYFVEENPAFAGQAFTDTAAVATPLEPLAETATAVIGDAGTAATQRRYRVRTILP